MSGDARGTSPMVGVDFDPSARMHSSLIDPRFAKMGGKNHRTKDDGLITYENDKESIVDET